MLRYLSIGAVIVLAASACDRLLNEPNPSTVLSSTLQQPQNAGIMVASAIADFDCAYAQYVLASGLTTDELLNGQLQSVAFDNDRRTMSPTNTGNNTGFVCESNAQTVAFYLPIQIARQDGDTAAKLLKGWTDAQVPGRQDLLAQAEAYAGYADLIMGEGMCTTAIDGGPAISADSALGVADAHFTDAIANATAAADQATLGLALLGRARERLDRGKPVLAKADALGVPASGFEVDATYSAISLRTENRVWSQMWRDGFAGVEGPFQHATDPALPPGTGSPDPRVQTDSLGSTGANGVPIIAALKYSTVGTPIPIAKSAEAQLIVAEADVDAGDFAGANTILNGFETAAGLTPFPAFADSATAISAVIAVRSRELFLEGHRLSDFIRHNLPLNPAAGTPYPYGAGGFYGSQLCYPLPAIETLNNPNTQ